MTQELTREQWLNACAELLWPKVVAQGGEKPAKYRVSCGWPSKSPLRTASKASRRIGECWVAGSEDEAREIFISPALAHPVEVADVLLHELIHAALPPETGHKHPFPRIAKQLGLEGKPTATYAGEELAEELRKLTDQLGKYPHAKLDASVRVKQRARQMKVECADCGCVIRMARSWIDRGLPTCSCGGRFESLEYDDGSDNEPLLLRASSATFVTEDGRFELATSRKQALTTRVDPETGEAKVSVRKTEGEALVFVTDVESGRVAARRNRADALAFIEAVREGIAEFPELEPDVDQDPDMPFEDDELGFPEPTDDDLYDDDEDSYDFEDEDSDPRFQFEIERGVAIEDIDPDREADKREGWADRMLVSSGSAA